MFSVQGPIGGFPAYRDIGPRNEQLVFNATPASCVEGGDGIEGRGFQQDAIWDFQTGIDKLSIASFLFNGLGFAGLIANAWQSGAHTIINAGHGDLIVLGNFSLSNLQAGDVVFF